MDAGIIRVGEWITKGATVDRHVLITDTCAERVTRWKMRMCRWVDHAGRVIITVVIRIDPIRRDWSMRKITVVFKTDAATTAATTTAVTTVTEGHVRLTRRSRVCMATSMARATAAGTISSAVRESVTVTVAITIPIGTRLTSAVAHAVTRVTITIGVMVEDRRQEVMARGRYRWYAARVHRVVGIHHATIRRMVVMTRVQVRRRTTAAASVPARVGAVVKLIPATASYDTSPHALAATATGHGNIGIDCGERLGHGRDAKTEPCDEYIHPIRERTFDTAIIAAPNQCAVIRRRECVVDCLHVLLLLLLH